MIAVAMDGPVGAGKSSVARAAAKRLGYIYVDTGALYRAIGLFAERSGIDTDTQRELLEQKMPQLLPQISLQIALINGVQNVILNGENVSDAIREPKISLAASAVSALPIVREFLLEVQRDLARINNVIMDGRDIGTVVLPNAEVKIFITANAEARAKRRFDELAAKGMDVDFNQVLEDLNRRDYQDSHREIAPLKQAQDAVLLDTTELNFEQTVEAVINLIEKR